MVKKHDKDWCAQLTYALWAYRTSVLIAIGTSLYNLVYGVDVIIPLDLDIHSFIVSLRRLIDDDTYHTNHLNQLELHDECWLETLKHLQAYQKYLSK